MAYAFDDEYNLQIPGFAGARLGIQQNHKANNKMYPSMEPKQAFSLPDNLAKNVTMFKYHADGSLSGFVPDSAGGFMAKDPNLVRTMATAAETNLTPKGQWVGVEGMALDKSTLTGQATGDVYFEDDGAPLAVFKSGDQINGYMRLATQSAKQADSLALGNNSGTVDGIRQNAQRRTLY